MAQVSAATPQPPFNPVDTTAATTFTKDEVESPSLSNSNALARFEFESGRGKDGTKILMIEWEEDNTTRDVRGDWHISWEGKSTVLRADDQTGNDINRLYFLLPPGTNVPSIVTLTHRPTDGTGSPTVWRTNPLPAIFPPELLDSARQAGKKGVLHTIWAKKRLQALQKEIDSESKVNIEGVGLMMALQEKEWIEQNFGVVARPNQISVVAADGPAPLIPSSPRSPGGGRLMEKLKGLKLGTSEKDLTSRQEPTPHIQNPLSPESSDVAVSSFAAFKGPNPSALAAKPPQRPVAQQAPAFPRVAAQGPPPEILAQQQQQLGGMASMDAFASPSFTSRGGPAPPDDDKEDDLFALPMSPRSPEMTKSPFSFAVSDTQKYLRGENV